MRSCKDCKDKQFVGKHRLLTCLLCICSSRSRDQTLFSKRLWLDLEVLITRAQLWLASLDCTFVIVDCIALPNESLVTSCTSKNLSIIISERCAVVCEWHVVSNNSASADDGFCILLCESNVWDIDVTQLEPKRVQHCLRRSSSPKRSWRVFLRPLRLFLLCTTCCCVNRRDVKRASATQSERSNQNQEKRIVSHRLIVHCFL